jgi:hypothetical protein
LKLLYIFDGGGACLQKRLVEDEASAMHIVDRVNPAAYIISDEDVHLSRARFVGGALVDQEPSVTAEAAWDSIRSVRWGLLVASDWTQLPDVPLATKEAWATYRQALRDVTDQPDPFNIVWPVAPG